MNGARVLLLGVTYKRDVADQRESPAGMLGRKLLARGAALAYHDPYVPQWRVDGAPIRKAPATRGRRAHSSTSEAARATPTTAVAVTSRPGSRIVAPARMTSVARPTAGASHDHVGRRQAQRTPCPTMAEAAISSTTET